MPNVTYCSPANSVCTRFRIPSGAKVPERIFELAGAVAAKLIHNGLK
jgi:hypothetical protein